MPQPEQIDGFTEGAQPGPEVTGCIFDIQRFSLHDGPGIRTTVFFKGCPLRCVWCHNPEGMDAAPAISFLPEKCIACGECVSACEHQAHCIEATPASGSSATHLYYRARCEVCGRCTKHCDTRALEVSGRRLTVAEIMTEVRQDKAFYASSGGGLSISGGEPLAQVSFACALLAAAGEEGIHRCVETSGFASWGRLALVAPLVDLFLFDLKETDPQRHAQFIGQSNELILNNLRGLHDGGARVEIQCPIVPGFNDREEHIAGIAALVRSMPGLAGVRLLPYHPLGTSKLDRFGLRWPAGLPTQPLPKSRLEYWIGRLRQQEVRVLNAPESPSR
jgi:pyruvate formate lyase activating enzyme